MSLRLPNWPDLGRHPILAKLLRYEPADITWQAIRHFLFEDGFIVAGYIAFTALFALFPFLIFLLALAGFLGQGEAANDSIELALDLVPHEVARVLRPAIEDIRNQATPGLMTLSIALSLWFASSGIESLRHALDRAYGVEGEPNFVWARAKSILLTAVTASSVLVVMIVLIGGPFIRDLLEWMAQRRLFDHDLYFFVRYAFGLLLLFGVTLLLHLVLPNAELRLSDVLPGVLISVVFWVEGALLYSFYLANFARYSVTYGSLGGIVLTLFFFYISAAIFIFGAQINAAVRRKRRGIPDTYVPPPELDELEQEKPPAEP